MKPALACVCLSCMALVGTAADWPQWRGPARDGVSAERVNTSWPSGGPRILWRANAGTGFSSIVVSGGRAITMGNTNNTDVISCFDALSGMLVWQHTYPARLDPQYYEGGPGSTPTVHNGRVYTLSKWGTVNCLDATKGTLEWKHDLWTEGIRSNRWGFAGSPLVYRNLLLLNAAEAGAALDLGTGKMVWHNGTNVAGYASPVLIHQGNRDVLLIFGSEFLFAVDPATGKEFWRHKFKTSYDTNNTDPIPWRDAVFISSFSRGCALLRLHADAAPEVIYANKNLHNHLSPGILEGDFLYAFNGEAKFKTDLRCLHLPTGQIKWTAAAPSFGSMISAADALLILTEKGELMAAKASPEGLKVLGTAQVLDKVCWTPPALSNGLLYLRNARGDLACVDLRPDAGDR